MPDDLKFLKKMGATWEGLYIPNQKLEALTRSTENPQAAIRQLIGTQNDPIVRHRLSLFAERLDVLAEKFSKPAFVVLEFVRQDFMGKKAKAEYLSFQRKRAEERKLAREDAEKAGATERAAGLKMELLTAQKGICLYTGAPLIPTELDQYVIDHIVPRAKNGPDAAVNYVLTTQRTNDEKLDRTPYEWLRATPGWDAYIHRVKERIGTLRNKKAQLLTSPEAETLVEKYTALAETAWISKLAQTIIGLRFGWPGGIEDGKRRVIVVSGGLTGRIRRKYKLNSLLNPDAATEEEAEQKNRNDDRHHALDAMVISFLPNWARNATSTGFFRFPEGVNRDLFGREIEAVVPKNVAVERAAFERTYYGSRCVDGKTFIVGRECLADIAITKKQDKRFLKKLKDIETHQILDGKIRADVEAFLAAQPDLTIEKWDAWCMAYSVGENGSCVRKVMVTKSKPDAIAEYKDVAKDATGQWLRGAKHRGYFIYDTPAPTKKEPSKRQIEVRPVYVHESKQSVAKEIVGNVLGYFESGCAIKLERAWRFRGQEYPAGTYICTSLWANRNAKLRHPRIGEIGPIGLPILLDAGFQRTD